MNITRKDIDALNAVLTIEVTASDYNGTVAKVLKDYRKNANIPGFRKGHVPMSLIKKQYERAVKADEINKLLQKSLNNYLIEEKLDILGSPLPKPVDNFDWENETLLFDFELGLTPEINVNFPKKNTLTEYKIEVDKELLDKEIENLQKKYGTIKSDEKVTKKSTVNVTFFNEEKEIKNDFTFDISEAKDARKWSSKKVGSEIIIAPQDLFEDTILLAKALNIPQEEAKEIDTTITCTINEISHTEPAALDQALFDKIFGKDNVKSEEELRERLQKDAEGQFQTQSDQQLLNAVTDHLVDHTSFELPEVFLKKWLQVAGKEELTPEQAEEEYKNSEKGIRYQLIESELRKDNKEKLQVEYSELEEFIKERTKAQMAQFGMTNPSDEEVANFVQHITANQEEVKRLENQLMGKKLLDFYKENITFKTKKVNYEDFFKEVYKTEK